jgi:sulfur relay (sulfurtransferase) complex TusBCD TusD component (DsrE family)
VNNSTIVVFTRNGMGDGPASLQQILAAKYLSLTLESGNFPAKILFYTDGVKLVCDGSPVLDQLMALENAGVELVICKTCLDTYNLAGNIRAGIVGGMPDILESLQKAEKVISL